MTKRNPRTPPKPDRPERSEQTDKPRARSGKPAFNSKSSSAPRSAAKPTRSFDSPRPSRFGDSRPGKPFKDSDLPGSITSGKDFSAPRRTSKPARPFDSPRPARFGDSRPGKPFKDSGSPAVSASGKDFSAPRRTSKPARPFDSPRPSRFGDSRPGKPFKDSGSPASSASGKDFSAPHRSSKPPRSSDSTRPSRFGAARPAKSFKDSNFPTSSDKDFSKETRSPRPKTSYSSEDSSTSWNPVGRWYDDAVGEQGHYYHQNIVIPNVLKILDLSHQKSAKLLDIACGQGVLSRHLPSEVDYIGIDAAAQLIAAARGYNKQSHHKFLHADATKEFPLNNEEIFTHATLILAIQNIEDPLKVFKNAAKHLQANAPFVIVLNHPCFRIPRQSSWKVDEEHKIQYRRLDRYMTDMKIPIQTNPSKGQESTQSWSFHHPLSSYTKWLNEAGFTIDFIDEWVSDKVSEGKAAKMENRSREEFPLFMAIVARRR